MPHHWRPIKEKQGGDARVDEVRQIVKNAGGELPFAGTEENSNPAKWYALVDVTDVQDPDEMWKNIGANGPLKKLS